MPKKPAWCQSGAGDVHGFVPMGPGGPGASAGRPGKPGGPLPGGPHGDEMDPRGLVVPHPEPTTPGARRPAGVVTTSSSSAASAEDPSTTPLGDGVRRTGEAVVDELAVSAPTAPAGRAIGATGRPIGPTSAWTDDRRPAPGARFVTGGGEERMPFCLLQRKMIPGACHLLQVPVPQQASFLGTHKAYLMQGQCSPYRMRCIARHCSQRCGSLQTLCCLRKGFPKVWTQ